MYRYASFIILMVQFGPKSLDFKKKRLRMQKDAQMRLIWQISRNYAWSPKRRAR